MLSSLKETNQSLYIKKLEQLISTQLLPAYVEYRKQQGLHPTCDISSEILDSVKKQNALPALLKAPKNQD